MNLKNTLEPVVTVQDVMRKWGLKDARTAKKYMLAIPHLKAYRNLRGVCAINSLEVLLIYGIS